MQNPADLPSYRHPALDHLAAALKVVLACWQSLYGQKADFLPRAPQEPPAAYEARLKRAVFNNKYRSQIEATAGLLTAFDVTAAPATLDAATEAGKGVDGKGSDLKSFFKQADEIALRDGGCYVLTDNPSLSPEDAENRTAADQGLAPSTPAWTLVDRRNVLNWRTAYRGGVLVLEQATLLMSEAVPDGAYGTKQEPRYHVFRLQEGGVSLDVYSISDRGEVQATQPTKLAPLPRIPLRAYPNTSAPFPCKEDPQLPPLLKSAELNLKLFSQECNLDTIEYRVNCPTVWRVSSDPLDERPRIIFGPNHVIELSRDPVSGQADEVGVLEIEGKGIASLKESVETTKQEIDREGLGFLTGARMERSATEAWMSGAQVTASMNGWARAKQQAIRACVADWCMFTGEDLGAFEVAMDQSLLEMPLDAPEMQALLQLWQAGAIDQETLLELLRMGRQLPPGADIQEILERVRAEREADMPATPPPQPNGVIEPMDEPQPQETPPAE